MSCSNKQVPKVKLVCQTNRMSCSPGKVKLSCPQPGKTFTIGSEDKWLFENVSSEQVNISGTDVELFLLDIPSSKWDPVYGEPDAREYTGPHKIKAHVEWPEAAPDATEGGIETVWPGGIYIPRQSLEAINVRAPREGDVVKFWSIPFFESFGVRHMPNVPDRGYYFTMIKVVDDGHVNDQADFVAFRADLKRITRFTPERLLTNT